MEMQPLQSMEALFFISAPICHSLPSSSDRLALSFCRSKIYLHMSTCDCGFRWRERRQIPELPNDLLADFSADRKAKSRCRPNRNPHVTLSPAGRSPRRRSGSGGREVAYKGFLDRAAIHPGSLRIPAKPPAYSRINSPANSNIISPIDSAVNPPRGSRALLAQEFDVRFS